MDTENTELLITALMLIELSASDDDRVWEAHGLLQAMLPQAGVAARRAAIQAVGDIHANLAIQNAKSRQ